MFRRLRKKLSKRKLEVEGGGDMKAGREKNDTPVVKAFDHILADLAINERDSLEQRQQQDILLDLELLGKTNKQQSSEHLQRQRSNTDETEGSSLKSLPFGDDSESSQHLGQQRHHNPTASKKWPTTATTATSSSRNLHILSSMDDEDGKIVIYYAQSPSPSSRNSRQFTFSSNDDNDNDDSGNDSGVLICNDDDHREQANRKSSHSLQPVQSQPSLSRRRLRRSSLKLATMKQPYLGHNPSPLNERSSDEECALEPEPLYSL